MNIQCKGLVVHKRFFCFNGADNEVTIYLLVIHLSNKNIASRFLNQKKKKATAKECPFLSLLSLEFASGLIAFFLIILFNLKICAIFNFLPSQNDRQSNKSNNKCKLIYDFATESCIFWTVNSRWDKVFD